jgi:uncharacterized protein
LTRSTSRSTIHDGEKDIHWLEWLEKKLSVVANIKAAEIALLLLVLYLISLLLEPAEALTFIVSGTLGLVTFIAVEAISTILEMREEAKRLQGAVVRSGLGGFLYLNILDASFSFDGVIGAFALSNNMVVIALGLSIGAMFVRSMTIHLVQKGTRRVLGNNRAGGDHVAFGKFPYSRGCDRLDRGGVDRPVAMVVGAAQPQIS